MIGFWAYLVAESRQRLTRLGILNEDPALGVLVSETIQIFPETEEPRTKNPEQRSLTYRNRDTGLTTTITTDPKGLVTIQRTEGSLLTSVESYLVGSGLAGSGLAGSGLAGSGLAGSGLAGSGLAGSQKQNSKKATSKIAFRYDALGRRSETVDPRTGERKTVYDPATGRVTAEIDAENRATRYAYYPAEHPAAGRLATVVNAEGKQQHVAYTDRGEQRAVWGDSVQPLLYDYNEYGEMVAMRTFQSTPEGDPSHVEDTGAKTAWHFHEATGALLKKAYADGHGPEYAYNEAGQLKERRWAREHTRRVDTPVHHEADPSDSADPKQYSQKANSKIATSYAYDTLTAQLTQTASTDGTKVAYAYNSEGQLQKVTDATGAREFTYDLRGQITKESVTLLTGKDTPPLTYEINRSYTALGQPKSVHLVSGADPDNLSRAGETGGAKPGTSNLKLSHEVAYEWNEHNQLSSVKSLAGEFTYGYNEHNPALLTKMTGPVHSVETSYEPHRNLVTGVTNRAVAPNPNLIPNPNPNPNPNPQPSTKNEEPGTVLSSYIYSNDLLGRRETISQGGEAFWMLKLGENKIDVAYNDRSEVTGAITRRGDTLVAQLVYAYDGIGNRTTAERSWDKGQESPAEEAKTLYETNALNQYTAIKSTPANAASSKLITKNQALGTPSHDPDGNLLEDACNTYTWNADNNLIRVESKDGKLRLDYIYDFQSRRTVRVETKEPGTKNEEPRTTYFLYDDWNVLAEIESVPAAGRSGTLHFEPATLYSWGRDLSGSLQGAGGVGGLLAISKVNSSADEPGGAQLQTLNLTLETLYPTYDANGNIGQLLDADANVVAAYTYDPFGNVTEMAGSEATENPWRFSTKPVEAGTGWLYYGYRWYDAEMGRWVNRDPIEENGGVNLYGFVGNDGVKWADVLGLDKCSSEIIAGHGWHEPGSPLENLIDSLERNLKCGNRVTAVGCFSGDINDRTPSSVNEPGDQRDASNIPDANDDGSWNPNEPGYLRQEQAYADLHEKVLSAMTTAQTDCASPMTGEDGRKCPCDEITIKVNCQAGGYPQFRQMSPPEGMPPLCGRSWTLNCESEQWNPERL